MTTDLFSNASTSVPAGLPSILLPSSSSNSEPVVPGEADAASQGTDEYLIILPFIVLFGLCGNLVSLVAIFHSRLRKMAANQYLIVLTLADSVFLLGLLMVLFKVDFTGYLFCVGIEYVLMTASYVSSWSIAALTIERYLAIAHPLKHVQYGHVSRWRMMCFWVPIPFILNLVQFVALTPNNDPTDPSWPNVRKCTVEDGQLQMVVETFDVVLCYVLPCFIVVALNLVIASKVESAEKNFLKPLTKSKSTYSNNNITSGGSNTPLMGAKPSASRQMTNCSNDYSSKHSKKNSSNRSTTLRANSRATGQASSTGSTRILLVVPIVYILLNTPFYLIRMIDTIALNVFESKAFSIQGGLNDQMIVFLYNAAHYLYYVNFACDVVVYAFSSANFRRTVIIAWRRLLCPNWAKKKDFIEYNLRHSNNRPSNNNYSGQHGPEFIAQQRTVRVLGAATTRSVSSSGATPTTQQVLSSLEALARRSAVGKTSETELNLNHSLNSNDLYLPAIFYRNMTVSGWDVYKAIKTKIKAGDKLAINRGSFEHIMIFLDDGKYAHHDKDSDEIKLVEEHEMEGIVNNSLCRIANEKDATHTPLPIEEIVKKAESKIGDKNYSLLSKNCEHFANFCRYGEESSNQVVDYIPHALSRLTYPLSRHTYILCRYSHSLSPGTPIHSAGTSTHSPGTLTDSPGTPSHSPGTPTQPPGTLPTPLVPLPTSLLNLLTSLVPVPTLQVLTPSLQVPLITFQVPLPTQWV
uniref:G-protein coupled receptors family 1 profile domain-containing protein n=1 Tax=Ditylenchus dipsaci TaxID=166011 RepID=A0A915EML2_9BILA